MSARPFPEVGTRIIRTLQEAGHDAVYAGGCVRDFLLDRPAKDFDIATGAPPEAVQQLFKRVTDLQGKAFGVVRVIEGEETYEVATFRKDGSYGDGRRPDGVTFTGPEEDAQRRDFTVNGMFYDPIHESVRDYVGGQVDLKKRLLRAIGQPSDRFREDHLRLYRAVRFAAALDFEIDPDTWQAVCDLAELGAELAPERVREELDRCLTGPDPRRAITLLVDSGLLEPWIPEVALMKGVEQPAEYHPEGDVFTHVSMMLGHLKDAPSDLAWSVLLHDIAKPDTFRVDANGRIRFNGHESVGAAKSEEILRRLRFSNEQIERVCTAVANHMAFKDVPNMRLSTLKRFLAQPTFAMEMDLHRIDCTCSHGALDIYAFLRERADELSQEEIAPPPLVTGKDLIGLGMPPSPKMGLILKSLSDDQLEGLLRDREHALDRARELMRAMGFEPQD